MSNLKLNLLKCDFFQTLWILDNLTAPVEPLSIILKGIKVT